MINTPSKSRCISLDAVCGLLIIHMIVGHAFAWAHIVDDVFYEWSRRLLFFFMPWFFYKSGMFHKKQSISNVFRSGYHKFLKPYIIYSIIGESVRFIVMFSRGDLNVVHYTLSPIKAVLLEGAVYGNLALWFLLSLYIVKVVVVILDHYNINIKLSLLMTLSFAYLCYVMCSVTCCSLPYTLLNVPMGLFFYLMGLELKEVQYRKFFIIVSLLTYIISIVIIPSQIDFRTGNVLQGIWIIYIISSISGIILFNNLFRIAFLQIHSLVSIGRDSLSYYCIHWILFYLIVISYDFSGIYDIGSPDYIELCFLLLWSAFILPVFSYWTCFIKTRYPKFGKYL